MQKADMQPYTKNTRDKYCIYEVVGKDRVIVLKEGQQPEGDREEGCLINFTGSTGEAVSEKEIIYVTVGPYMPMQFELTKSGKVKRIYYFNS